MVKDLAPIVVDYSARRLTGKELRTDPNYFVQGVMRYLPKEGSSRVAVLNPEEYNDLRAHGIQVGFIGEQVSAKRPLESGYEGGKHDALWFKGILDRWGIPFRCLYAAYDYPDSDPTSINRSLEYARGWREILGPRGGAYGFETVLNAIRVNNRADFYWYCGRRSTPDPNWASLYQWNNGRAFISGVECDINYILKSDFGQNGYIPWEEVIMGIHIEDVPMSVGPSRLHRACEVGLVKDGGNSIFVKRQWVAFSVGWLQNAIPVELVIARQGGGYFGEAAGGNALKVNAGNDDRIWWELPENACSWSLSYDCPSFAEPALYVIRELV